MIRLVLPLMITNYLKIAWRNLVRNKVFSAINIVGLAMGLATCLLIGLYILDELSYDRFNDKADQIVRVVFRASINGERLKEAHVMPPVAQTLKAEFPDVVDATRFRVNDPPLVTNGDKSFPDETFAYADSNFFQVFTLPFLLGDPKTALIKPNSLVITQRTAKKYFGDTNPIGKLLTVKAWDATFTITGVIKDIPTNSHFHRDFFASISSFPDAKSPSWLTSEFYTYLVLPKGYDYKQLEAKLPNVLDKYMGPQIQKAFGMSMAQFRRKGNEIGLFLQPLTDIHLRSDLTLELEPMGDIRYVYMFSAVALFMLLIACINFMNLSTAGASKRAREVGIRKVMGSKIKALVSQFLLESLLLTSIALGISLGLVRLALPLFNQLAGKEMTLAAINAPWLIPVLLLFGLFVGVLAGSYPAFFLSSFKPITTLKGQVAATRNEPGRSGISLRSGLVVLQFFMSMLLIVGTMVVYQQLRYIQNKKLGYDKDRVIVLRQAWRLGPNVPVLRQQLLQDSRVANVSVSGYLPAGLTNNNNFISYADDNASQLVKTLRYDVDDRYIPTLGMSMAAGRNFSEKLGTDSSAVILNEKAAKAFGWGKNALGHTLTNPDNQGRKTTYNVIGIIKDFHFKSLHERISPLLMVLSREGGSLIIKTRTNDVSGLLTTLNQRWLALKADVPFTYSFLDESFTSTYISEQKTGRILGIFAGLTIFVACLGLFGLATFTAEQRTKEIGVRKVLGASVSSIVGLLSKDFLKLVLVALLLASPIAWYMMNRWLRDFAYRIEISWWLFGLAGLLVVVIALVTVSFQSIKAALMNPVKSLRSD